MTAASAMIKNKELKDLKSNPVFIGKLKRHNIKDVLNLNLLF